MVMGHAMAVGQEQAIPGVDYWKILRFCWSMGHKGVIFVAHGRRDWMWVWAGECDGRVKGWDLRLAVWWSCGRWGQGRENLRYGTLRNRSFPWLCAERVVLWFRFAPSTGWDKKPLVFPPLLVQLILSSTHGNLSSKYRFLSLEPILLPQQTDSSSKFNVPLSFSSLPRLPSLFISCWIAQKLHFD